MSRVTGTEEAVGRAVGRAAMVAATLAGCAPAPCGTVTVGGGEATLTVTPASGASWVVTVPGVEHPGAAWHRDGAWLERWVDRGYDTVELGIDRRLEAEELPCGASSGTLAVLASMDTTARDQVWLTVDLTTDDGMVLLSASGYADRELRDADADGTLTTTLDPFVVSPSCEAFQTEAWTVTLDWAFDPDLVSDDVALCY